jgi:hypothetical protein
VVLNERFPTYRRVFILLARSGPTHVTQPAPEGAMVLEAGLSELIPDCSH